MLSSQSYMCLMHFLTRPRICLHLFCHLFRFALHISHMFATVLAQTENAGTNVRIYVAYVRTYVGMCVNQCNNKCIKLYFVKIISYFVQWHKKGSKMGSCAFVLAYVRIFSAFLNASFVCICYGINCMSYDKLRSNKTHLSSLHHIHNHKGRTSN